MSGWQRTVYFAGVAEETVRAGHCSWLVQFFCFLLRVSLLCRAIHLPIPTCALTTDHLCVLSGSTLARRTAAGLALSAPRSSLSIRCLCPMSVDPRITSLAKHLCIRSPFSASFLASHRCRASWTWNRGASAGPSTVQLADLLCDLFCWPTMSVDFACRR